MNNITSAQIIDFLQQTINEDIVSLNSIKPEYDKNSYENTFIASLIDTKIKIKDTLPVSSAGNSESVSTPQSTELRSYADVKDQLKDNTTRLAQVCFEIEESQRNYIKNQIHLKGLPKDIKSTMHKVLEIYDQVYDHLKRSKSTDQLGTIHT